MNASRMLAIAWLALSALAAATAGAAITPDAQPVVDRFVEVSGGRAALQNVRALHLKGALAAYGLVGTVESWRQWPDKRTSNVAIGPITIRDWSIAGRSWRTDPGSGRLVALDGKDLEDANSAAWFENLRWLEPDQGGGSIAVGPAVKDTLGSLMVLEVTPPVGKSRRLEFDGKTGLLVRTISKHDQTTVVSTSSDYRDVDGWRMPFRTVQEVKNGAAASTAITTVESAEVPAGLPDERFAPPQAAEGAGVRWLGAKGLARLPFDYRGQHVWLRASVNGGPPADFLYDTGANITLIDSAYAARIGLHGAGSVQAQGAGSTGGASFATLDKLRIAAPDSDGVELSGLKVAVVSVNPALAPFLWRDCAGIIGFDVVGRFVNRIDFDGRRLSLLDAKTFVHEGKAEAIPMTLAGNVPVVNITVDGRYRGAARVDVGSDAVLDLHTPFVSRNGLIAKAGKCVTFAAGGIGGEFESRQARMRSIEIGPYRLADPLVGLSTTTSGAFASEDYAGNIGNGLLDRFVVTLDYDRRQVWLEPGAHYGERRNFTRFGALLLKYGGEVKAGRVLPGSAADRAGLREGDLVIAIDGKPAAECDRDQLDRRFEDGPPGSKVALTVTRAGRPKTLAVTLRDML